MFRGLNHGSFGPYAESSGAQKSFLHTATRATSTFGKRNPDEGEDEANILLRACCTRRVCATFFITSKRPPARQIYMEYRF